MRDLKNNIGVVHLLDAQDVTNTDTNSSILDLQGFDSACILVNVGAITTPDANSYLVPTLQESDTTTDGDFTAVAAGDIIGAFTKIDAAAEDQVTQFVGYRGTKRYIRCRLEFTDGDGGIANCLVSVDGIVSHASEGPTVAPAAVTAT